MKLYAHVASDRASKGQGGNHDVTTVYTVEHDTKNREEIARTILKRNENTFEIKHIPVTGDCVTTVIPIKR